MSIDEVDDSQLISSYLAGDDDSFTVLYERYRKVLYSFYLKSLSGDRALADDLFQQTWLKVIKSLPKYRHQQTFLAWLMMVGRNTMLDHWRKIGRKKESELDESYMGESKMEQANQALSRKELEALVDKLVVSLPEEQREVFIMRQSDISFKEIAEIQGISLNTALGRMHYAVSKLKKSLKDWI